MSASLINFESAREKEEQRQFERKARQGILQKAQKEYEDKERRQEAARQRGEHTWMLPSVEARLAREPSAGSSEKKKKKKDKKKKKKKKEKKQAKACKKKDSSSSSSSESEDDDDKGKGEDVWVESTKPTPLSYSAPQPLPEGSNKTREVVKRDSWMEMTSLFGTFSREQMRERDGTSRKKVKEEEEKRRREAAKPGSHSRELNPYYKDGGTGLPEEEDKVHPASSFTPVLASAPQMTGLDAGWLRRALQRAKEQASVEGRTLEEVASERWGSIARFNELLAEAEGRGRSQREHDMRKQSSWKRQMRRSRSRSNERDGMRKGIRGESREKDRRRSRSRERGRSSSNRSRSQERVKERQRSKTGERERNRSRSRSEEREKSRSRKQRSRCTEKRRHRQRHSSSSSCSSSSSSRSRSGGKKEVKQNSRDDSGGFRYNQKLLKPSEESLSNSRLSTLQFQKPDEDTDKARPISLSAQRGSSRSSSNRWQKKDYRPPPQQPHRTRHTSSSSSSSSSSSNDNEGNATTADKARGGGGGGGQGGKAATSSSTTTNITSPTPPAVPLTDKEMNELAAKIMKAELMGNEAQAVKLKSRLEVARAVRAAGSGATLAGKVEDGGTEEQVILLTRTDIRGISRPITAGGEAEVGRGKRTKVKTHGKDGQRARYFPDDDQYNLKTMFEREKGTTADDQNAMFEKAATMNPERLNDDYDIDDMFMSRTATRDSAAKQAERDRKKAIQEHQRAERSLESCQWCFDNKEMPKHLIVALGTKCYVSLPSHQSLTPGHCCISPIHHTTCCIQAEEDLWDEIQSFRKSLVKMFASRGEDCIFFETAKRLRHFPHMVLHCVPLPRETGDMAPIYFKKAIQECEQEWAQNKKLVDLKGRDVRRAVPKGLPYFFVDFAMDAGFAHVIEDEQEFPNNFAQEIIGGMLDLDNNLWRKPRRENFETQRRKVMEFSRWYKEFDPTQQEG